MLAVHDIMNLIGMAGMTNGEYIYTGQNSGKNWTVFHNSILLNYSIANTDQGTRLYIKGTVSRDFLPQEF